MADEAAGTGGEPRKREHTLKGEGKRIDEVWEELLRDVMEQGARQVQAQALTEYPTPQDDVVVRIPIQVSLRFPRKLEASAADGEADCACIITEEVCICYGTCPDFPECCDEGPILTQG